MSSTDYPDPSQKEALDRQKAGEYLTPEEGFTAIPAHFASLRGDPEKWKAAVARGRARYKAQALAVATDLAEKIAHMQVLERKKGTEIAVALGLKPGTYRAWVHNHRDLMDAAIASLLETVKQERAGAALAIRVGLSEAADDAVDALHAVVKGEFDKAADGMARTKAAQVIIDRVDPPEKGGKPITVNVFSDRAAALLTSLAGQDMTPRRPLSAGRTIEVEAEVVQEDVDEE